MLHIEDFAKMKGVTRRAVEKQINRGELLSKNIGGKTYIITPEEVTAGSLNKKQVNNLILTIKKDFDSKLSEARVTGNKKEVVAFVESEVANWKMRGIIIKGYNAKSCYRKIKEGKTERKVRTDKGVIKHPVLAESFKKARALASKIYFENAKPNLLLTVDLIQHYAKIKEEYYELAAVPRNTLYRQLQNDFKQSGFGNLHQYFNHHNLYHAAMPKVTGAFTDDLDYMDYIFGDDHKADVHQVFYYDKNLKKIIQAEVNIWVWSEGLTMEPLSWVIKIGKLTTEDLILSLSEAVLKNGLPNKRVVVDNGIGRSEGFKNFLNRLYDWKMRFASECSPLGFSEAYTPTNKALAERMFRMFKEELDVFYKNFVGPDKRNESRHESLSLSPEQCESTFEDYKRSFENYLYGFFVERKRNRVIKGEKRFASIKELSDEFSLYHEKLEVTPAAIRYAAGAEFLIKYKPQITFKGHTFLGEQPLPYAFHEKEFLCFYNPYDLSAVDLYATEDIVDRNSGEYYEKGSFIITMQNIRYVKDKYELVKKNKKALRKEIRHTAENYVALTDSLDPSVEDALTPNIKPDGKIEEKRNEKIKEVEAFLNYKITQMQPEVINNLIPAVNEDETEPETSLTFDED